MSTNKESSGPRSFAQALEKTIAHSSLEVLNGESQLYSLVADYLGGSPQSRQSLNLLRNAIDCGIPARMYGGIDKDKPTQTITVATCRKLLMDNYSISEEAAGQFMNEFAAALGWNIIVEQPKPAPIQSNIAPAQPKPAPVQLKTAPVQPKRNIDFSALSFKELLDADRNNPEVQFILGNRYNVGYGVPRDFAQAAIWYRKAAEQGHDGAQYYLGGCYQYGNGVPQNYTEAVRWFYKAAVQGLYTAQYTLGKCYHDGEGVPKDDAQAVIWFRKSAEQGYIEAQKALGDCYYNGTGIKKDIAEAAHWYKKAADQGYTEAQYMYDRITSKRS